MLDDLSGRNPPDECARRAIGAYRHHQADRLVAETNFGGAMVEVTLRAVDASAAYKSVTASRGKVARAEPVAALYEQNKIHHVGTFAALEDQMAGFSSDFNKSVAGYSPDRVDALVFALTELMLGESCAGWLDYYKRQADIVSGRARPLSIPKTVLDKGVKAVMDYCYRLPGQPGSEREQTRPQHLIERVNEIDTSDAVTMRASPHASFYVSGPDGRCGKYQADENGVVHGVAQIHVAALKRAGCSQTKP